MEEATAGSSSLLQAWEKRERNWNYSNLEAWRRITGTRTSKKGGADSSWCSFKGPSEVGSARVGEIASGIHLLLQEGKELLLECCSQEQEANKKPKSGRQEGASPFFLLQSCNFFLVLSLAEHNMEPNDSINMNTI